MNATVNMTEGKPLRLIISFGLPMLFSNIFQQVYTVMDSLIVGRFLGVTAFASVGAAGFYYLLTLDIVLGFTQGLGTLYAHRFGAGDEEGLRRVIAQSILLTAAFAIIITALSLIGIRPVLTWINTPAELMDGACTYLFWLVSSVPVMFAYNIVATILRSLGNSRVPFWAMIFSSVINIVSDLILVYAAGWGIAGVAASTVFSMLFAFLYCLYKLRGIEGAHIRRMHFSPDGETIREMLRLSMPPALRNAVGSCGGLAVQYVVNGFGTLFVAGVSAASKYFGTMNLIGYGLEGAVAVFTGQNYGARKPERIREGVRAARRVALVGAVVIALLTLAFGRGMIALLVVGSSEETQALVGIGYRYLLALAICFPAVNVLCIHRAAVQGMGNSLIPMLSGFVELALRMGSVLALPLLIGEWGIFLADGISWLGAAALLTWGYCAVYRKRVRTCMPIGG